MIYVVIVTVLATLLINYVMSLFGRRGDYRRWRKQVDGFDDSIRRIKKKKGIDFAMDDVRSHVSVIAREIRQAGAHHFV